MKIRRIYPDLEIVTETVIWEGGHYYRVYKIEEYIPEEEEDEIDDIITYSPFIRAKTKNRR